MLNGPDFEQMGDELEEFNHKVGNVEDIGQLYEPNSFDVVTCAHVVGHLVDPLGSITQMYELVRPGGVLMLSSFGLRLEGMQDHLLTLQTLLKAEGYQVAFDYDYDVREKKIHPEKITAIIIRKTKPSLDFPVEYDSLRQGGRYAAYQLSRNLPSAEAAIPPDIAEVVGWDDIPVDSLFHDNVLGGKRPQSSVVQADERWISEDLRRWKDSPWGKPKKIRAKISRLGKEMPSLIQQWKDFKQNQWENALQGILN